MSALYDELIFSALDQVRLLNVAPATEFDDPLICTLSIASLAEVNDNYITLSYCWGSPDRASPIQVNGHPHYITEELALALRSVRAIANDQPIWVDQLSISQVDDKEKSQQLLLMTQIFSEASSCICYLGEDDGQVDQAVEYMEMALEEIKKLPADHLRQTSLPAEISDLLYNAPGKAEFLSLAKRRYFMRRWIMQETVLSRDPTGICGNRYFAMGALFFVIAFTTTAESDRILKRPVSTNFDDHLFAEPPALSHHYLRNQLGQAARRFKPLLLLTIDAGVTDVRDLFFAIRGLATDRDDFPNPDYSWDVARTFREFTAGLVHQGFGLWCLQQAHQNNYADTPSWVPDWRRITRWPQLNLIPDANFQSVMKVDSDSRILELSCLKLTRITQCSLSNDDTGLTDATAFSLRALRSLELLFDKFRPAQTAEDVLKRLAAVVARFTHESDSVEGAVELTCQVLATAAYHQEPTAKFVEENSTPFMLVKLVLENFQVVLTSSDVICVAPVEVTEGDELVLPEGSAAAIAVRHVGGGHYKYIGMAWVEGLPPSSEGRGGGEDDNDDNDDDNDGDNNDGNDDDADASEAPQASEEKEPTKYEKMLLV